MASKPETLFKKKVIDALLKIPRVAVFVIQQMSKRGDPDLLVCFNGAFIALELKKDTKSKASPLQKHILGKVTQAGGYARVCSPENLETILAEIKESYDYT